MPVLDNKNKVERVYLPSTKNLPQEEQAFVDMNTGPLTAGDIIGVDPKLQEELVMAVIMLTNRIAGWNFTDASGEDLPVTAENVRMLGVEDFTFLAEKLPQGESSLDDSEKKN